MTLISQTFQSSLLWMDNGKWGKVWLRSLLVSHPFNILLLLFLGETNTWKQEQNHFSTELKWGTPQGLPETTDVTWGVVFVWQGYHKKRPRIGWLIQQKFISSQFWRLEVKDQGVSRVASSEPLSLACRCLPSCCVFTSAFTVYSVYLFFLQGHQSYGIAVLLQLPHFNLITSLKILFSNTLLT